VAGAREHERRRQAADAAAGDEQGEKLRHALVFLSALEKY
jgi:hypothetical protein